MESGVSRSVRKETHSRPTAEALMAGDGRSWLQPTLLEEDHEEA